MKLSTTQILDLQSRFTIRDGRLYNKEDNTLAGTPHGRGRTSYRVRWDGRYYSVARIAWALMHNELPRLVKSINGDNQDVSPDNLKVVQKCQYIHPAFYAEVYTQDGRYHVRALFGHFTCPEETQRLLEAVKATEGGETGRLGNGCVYAHLLGSSTKDKATAHTIAQDESGRVAEFLYLFRHNL